MSTRRPRPVPTREFTRSNAANNSFHDRAPRITRTDIIVALLFGLLVTVILIGFCLVTTLAWPV